MMMWALINYKMEQLSPFVIEMALNSLVLSLKLANEVFFLLIKMCHFLALDQLIKHINMQL